MACSSSSTEGATCSTSAPPTDKAIAAAPPTQEDLALVAKWTCVALRDFLRARGLTHSGLKKAELVSKVRKCKECGLDPPTQTPTQTEADALEDWFTAPLSSQVGWINIEAFQHKLFFSIKNIHNYFIKQQLRKNQVTASKPFEKGFRIFAAKKVQNTSIYCKDPDSLEWILKADVLPSQRNDRQYKTAVAANKTTGCVLTATCTCIAGKCGACNHVAALMFAIDDFARTFQQSVSCTSQLSKWNIPTKGKIAPTPVKHLEVVKPVYGKHKAPRHERHEPIDPDVGCVTIDRVSALRKELKESSCGGLLFHQVWTNPSSQQISRLGQPKPVEE